MRFDKNGRKRQKSGNQKMAAKRIVPVGVKNDKNGQK
jgi:hypothetical protein